MSDTRGIAGVVYEPHEDRTDHVGEEFTETIALCRQGLIDTPDMDYLAHYSDGIYDFSLDRLDSCGEQPPYERRLLRRVGRQLTFRMQDLDEMLRPPRTGALLRLVLHYPNGFVVCTSVLPRVHLVSYSLAALRTEQGEPIAGTESLDRSMVALATGLRQRIGLPSQNPGGYEDIPLDPGAKGRLEPAPWSGKELDAVASACEQAVRHEDLHFVAYTTNGAVTLTFDCLGSSELRSHFTQISVKARRQYYRELAGEVTQHAAHFNLIMSSTLDGNLVRAVYDVEQGAVFSHRVAAGKFLMGVTLRQNAERAADSRLGSLADHCRRFVSG